MFSYDQFKLEGESEHRTGHVIIPKALNPQDNQYYVLKANKFGKQEYSYLETAFSNCASLFLPKGSSCGVHLVSSREPSALFGVAIEHLGYMIDRAHPSDTHPEYYEIKQHEGGTRFDIKTNIQSPMDIPYCMLSDLEHDTISQLMTMNDVILDYASLAAMLTASYTLEEDDLHKGNFGFYAIKKEDKIQIKFFKIDHDLMFADSIMSFVTRRYFHLTHGAEAFAITPDDLQEFPLLTQSSNGYWPAKSSYLANPLRPEEYLYNSEIEAFGSFGKNEAFIAAKWFCFLKHILLYVTLFERTLDASLDTRNPVLRAWHAAIMHALIARQAALKAVLLSLPEFRNFLETLDDTQKQALSTEIGLCVGWVDYKLSLLKEINLANGDTPLHTAIKSGCYRFEESTRMFSQYLHKKNDEDKTALDCAYEMYQKDPNPADTVSQDYMLIMRHLYERGGRFSKRIPEDTFQKMRTYTHESRHFKALDDAKDYAALKQVLQTIGEDCTLSLKGKKLLAVACVKRFIKSNQDNPDKNLMLQELNDDINGYSSEDEQAPLKYIRQLRSKLWFVRQIRGLYGRTTTLGELNGLIRGELGCTSGCFGFFSQRGVVENALSEAPVLINP